MAMPAAQCRNQARDFCWERVFEAVEAKLKPVAPRCPLQPAGDKEQQTAVHRRRWFFLPGGAGLSVRNPKRRRRALEALGNDLPPIAYCELRPYAAVGGRTGVTVLCLNLRPEGR